MMTVRTCQGRQLVRRIPNSRARIEGLKPLRGASPHRHLLACVLGCVLALTLTARGALVMYVSDTALVSNQPDQEVTAYVENSFGYAIDLLGIQFNVQTNDGEGLENAPKITNVDVLSGTVFESDSTGVGGGLDTDWRWELFTLENPLDPAPALPPNSILTAATITLDTSGIGSGIYTLSLATPAGPTTYFYADPASEGSPLMTLDGATLTVMPEPSVIVLLLCAWVAFVLIRVRPTPNHS